MIEQARAVVFDAVGTLLHPDPSAATVYETVGRKYGSRLSAAVLLARMAAAFRAEEEFDRRHGQVTDEARELERWRHIVRSTLDDVDNPEACFRELFTHFSQPSAWRCTPGTGETLAALAGRGLVLGMASNYDSRLRSVVAGLPELRAVGHLVISAEVGRRKPAPEFFQAMKETIGMAAGRIVFVGDDWANDYEGARRAGLVAVLFDPAGAFADQTIKRIRRLPDLLDA
jgi:putative hydrolase of the HAD superfamily